MDKEKNLCTAQGVGDEEMANVVGGSTRQPIGEEEMANVSTPIIVRGDGGKLPPIRDDGENPTVEPPW